MSFYFDGLYMFDCSNPANPTLVGYYDTSTELHQSGVYRGCWGGYPFLPSGNILASDMQTGLWVFGHNLVSSVDETITEFNSLTVYPNPVSEQLFLPSEFSKFRYSIFDVMGKEVKTGTAEGSLDVSSLTNGFFTLFIQTESGESATRFVKQ